MVSGGIPVGNDSYREDSPELQAGIDSNREGMGLNPNPLEVPKVEEEQPMWSLEFSTLDWLFEEG